MRLQTGTIVKCAIKHGISIIRLPHSIMKEKKATHGINCPCKECAKIRKTLRDKARSGEIYLSGLEEDKKKIMGAG